MIKDAAGSRFRHDELRKLIVVQKVHFIWSKVAALSLVDELSKEVKIDPSFSDVWLSCVLVVEGEGIHSVLAWEEILDWQSHLVVV